MAQIYSLLTVFTLTITSVGYSRSGRQTLTKEQYRNVVAFIRSKSLFTLTERDVKYLDSKKATATSASRGHAVEIVLARLQNRLEKTPYNKERRFIKGLGDHRLFKLSSAPLDNWGEIEGIGVRIKDHEAHATARYPEVEETLLASAQMAGLQVGDRLTRIDGQDVRKLRRHGRVLAALRGPAGSTARIEVVRGGRRQILNIVRRRYEPATVAISDVVGDVVVIEIKRFTPATMNSLRDLLKTLAKFQMRHLVFDLRGNQGGSLQSAGFLLNQFVAKNTVLYQLRGRGGRTGQVRSQFHGDSQGISPVFVIDHQTAGAASVVAAYAERVGFKVFGERTLGTGFMLDHLDLGGGKQVSVVRARILRPDLQEFEGLGFAPKFQFEASRALEMAISSAASWRLVSKALSYGTESAGIQQR